MKRSSLALAAGLLALAVTAPGFAQNPPKMVNKEEVGFKTIDGVMLKGTFYPSSKGANSPVVLFLHKLGGNRTQGDWESLAISLQAKGYAVMTFDFRGHGASTTLADPKAFWSGRHNQQYVAGYVQGATNPKKKIEFKDFNKSLYVPYLVNDIAAARHDLDNRNDNAQCNTSNLFIIGAEEGAALGFFWIISEYYRPAIYKDVNILGVAGGVVNNAPAAEDVGGAVWLSMRKNPGIGTASITFPYSQWVTPTPLRDQIQMWFAAGAKDQRGVDDAASMYDKILNADKRKDKLPLTSKKPIEGTNLRGVNLLGKKELPTDELIEKFLEQALKMRPNQAQKKRNASEFKPYPIDPTQYGFAPPG
jgi:pimeloyl-ACP methyl ester carboxylesterase